MKYIIGLIQNNKNWKIKKNIKSFWKFKLIYTNILFLILVK